MFPQVAEDWLDTASFVLLYHQHGGSGLALSIRDIEDMEINRIRWWVDRLEVQREAEAEAIRNAGKSK